MGFSIERQSMTHMVAVGNDDSGVPLTTSAALAFNLWTDMVTAGFQVVAFDGAALNSSKKVILRPTTAIDPLWATDPWHVYFEVKGTSRSPNPTAPTGGPYLFPVDRGLYMRIGSPAQLPSLTQMTTTLFEYPLVPDQFYTLTPEQETLIGLDNQNPRISVKTPMAYRLTVVERGFVIGAWTQALTEDTNKMAVMCVQRGVGCDGTVSSTGQKPLYMVTNVSATTGGMATGKTAFDGPRNNWFYSIVRERDTTQSRPPWVNSASNVPGVNGLRYNTNIIADENESGGQALNYFPTRWRSPVTTDTGEYILLFPFGLCSSRFAFSDEIDLIAVSKADAYQHTQQVPISIYGDNRVYQAYNSNNQDGTVNFDSGVRVFIMISGTGVTDGNV